MMARMLPCWMWRSVGPSIAARGTAGGGHGQSGASEGVRGVGVRRVGERGLVGVGY